MQERNPFGQPARHDDNDDDDDDDKKKKMKNTSNINLNVLCMMIISLNSAA